MPPSSFLSETLLKKYEYHMPFYRQINEFAHLGMQGLKEHAMTGWFKRTMGAGLSMPQPRCQPEALPQQLIESLPYSMDAPHEELMKLLPHKWKEYHLDAVKSKVRELAK